MGDPLMRRNPDLQSRTKLQNRSVVSQKKAIAPAHPTGLTNNLLRLFEARPPLEFKPPPEKRKCPPYTGMAQFVSNFAEKGDPEYQPPVVKIETRAQKKARIHKIRLEEGARKSAEELEKYDPNHNPDATGDPYKTLFVSRLNYETSESRIKREFEAYGPIKRVLLAWGAVQSKVKLVVDKSTSKPRGYAFIEYVHTRDMKAAYKQADGKKIDGRRVLVDVERGRTVPNWCPRRLGGGLGTNRIYTEDTIPKVSVGEKSLEQEREREKSRERSKDRLRDRDHREDRNYRDRKRPRDGERTRNSERESRRDRERGRDRYRDRPREKDRDKKSDYGEYSKYDGDLHHERERGDHNYDYNLDAAIDDYYERVNYERGEKKSAPDMDQEY